MLATPEIKLATNPGEHIDLLKLLTVSLAAFIASSITFFTGFGLGTLLLAILLPFFPVGIAVSITAVVHLLNSLFKACLLLGKASWKIVAAFGIPAIFSAYLGAKALILLCHLKPILSYSLAGRGAEVTAVKLVIAALLLVFVYLETQPRFRNLAVNRSLMPLGGVLSGFFGGVSGHQGAFRSMFLVKANLGPDAFVATGSIIATMVDLSRLVTYLPLLAGFNWQANAPVLVLTAGSAFAGTLVGNLWLKKITIESIQKTISVLIIFLASALASGII